MAYNKGVPLALQLPALSAEKIEHFIERVQNGNFSERELINLYDNANERHVTAVMGAIEIKMRADFPRAATRKFGPKEKDRKAPAAVGPQ